MIKGYGQLEYSISVLTESNCLNISTNLKAVLKTGICILSTSSELELHVNDKYEFLLAKYQTKKKL